jgi:histidine phosphotransferase ChpT
MNNPLHVLYAMSAKICHDIATPVNAIGLGLEMLDGRVANSETHALITQSAQQAGFKVSFYRMLLSPSDDTPSIQEAERVLQPFAKTHNIQLVFNCAAWPHQNGMAARLICGIAYVCMEGMPRGGKIAVTLDHAGHVVIESTGEPLQLRPLYLEIIQGTLADDAMTPKTVFMHYLMFLAQSCCFSVDVQSDIKNHLRFRVSSV